MSDAIKVVYGFAALIGLLLMVGVWDAGLLIMSGGKTLFGIGFLLFVISVGAINRGVGA